MCFVIGYGAYKYFTREYTEVRSRYMLDTIVEISATSKLKTIGSQIDSVFSYIQSLESKFDEYNTDSYISKINNSQEFTFPMDDDLYNLLVIADSLWRITDGAFDITIKPVWDTWRFNEESPVLPDSIQIASMIQHIGFDKLHFDKKLLTKPVDLKLTFGAIAKGYILDKAKDKMISMGLSNGIINSRSSMCFFGDRTPPLVYIQHPRNPDKSIASLHVKNKSVGTSGDYQQFFEIENTRYHHIINAHTGFPVEDVFSVTVISPSAAWADGLSTALFLMKPEEALDVVKKMVDTNCVIYYSQNSSIVSLKSEGMKTHNFMEEL